MLRLMSIVLWLPSLVLVPMPQEQMPTPRGEPVTVPGVDGTPRVGRWRGPTRPNAPVALIFCERDASPDVAAVVPALWSALSDEGIRSLTVDPAPVVPGRDALVQDARAFEAELRRGVGNAPLLVGVIGAGAAAGAMLPLAAARSDTAFVVALGPDLTSAETSRETIASLALRGGPPTLLMFAAVLQPGPTISASLDTLLKTPVHRPVDVSVKGSGESIAGVAADTAMWIAARLSRTPHPVCDRASQ